jgi:hypothetical protein
MRAEGMTVRDIGAALGISHQRAQQLISSGASGALNVTARAIGTGEVSGTGKN